MELTIGALIIATFIVLAHKLAEYNSRNRDKEQPNSDTE